MGQCLMQDYFIMLLDLSLPNGGNCLSVYDVICLILTNKSGYLLQHFRGNCILRVCVCILSHFFMSDSFASPWTVVHQVPLSKGFPRQAYQSGQSFLLQGSFLTQGLNLCLLHWQAGSLPLSHQGSLNWMHLLFILLGGC